MAPAHSVLALVADLQRQLDSYAAAQSKSVNLTGHNLSVAGVVAIANKACHPTINDNSILSRLSKSSKVVEKWSRESATVYGVNTGFGGSADVRTADTDGLERGLMQLLQSAILVEEDMSGARDPQAALPQHCLPESWVRAIVGVRINQCIRGHSAISKEVISSMLALCQHGITPFIPLRGTISASGDLMPLAYVAGTLEGNPDIYVRIPSVDEHKVVSADCALQHFNMTPQVFGPREGLGLVNGTAASAAAASLAVYEATHLALLAASITALASEGAAARVDWTHPFIAEVRPHAGQAQVSEQIRAFLQGSRLVSHPEDSSELCLGGLTRPQAGLAQDRYSLRTSPQWLGPQFEDLEYAHQLISIELNSTSDNPVTDHRSGTIYHGGNFQATSVTSAVEKIRGSLQMIGKMLFAQSTEIVNSQMSAGLPPNLAADDPSTSFCLKGLDINMAAYQSELSYLANPVSNHVQSAEMHNQSLNSLAFLSTRYTMQAIDVARLMVASALYTMCQAADLRAMHTSFLEEVQRVVLGASSPVLPNGFEMTAVERATQTGTAALREAWWVSAGLDAPERCKVSAAAFVQAIWDGSGDGQGTLNLTAGEMLHLRENLAMSLLAAFELHRTAFFKNPTSEQYLGKGSQALYAYVRHTLGVPMHRGLRDHPTACSSGGLSGARQKTIGSNVALIHKALRDGRLFRHHVTICADLGLSPQK